MRIIKTTVTVFVLSVMIASTAAIANGREGTGVGGTNSKRDQYLQKLKRELGPKVKVRLDPKSRDAGLAEWCSRVATMLRREKRNAEFAVRNGELAVAEQIVIDALVTAAESMEFDPDLGAPLTKTYIDRGLMISQALDETLRFHRQALMTKLNFLFSYVDFVVKVDSELDRPFYINYRFGHSSCWDRCRLSLSDTCYSECQPAFSFKGFQRRYLEFARRQLDMVVSVFTEAVYTPEYTGYRPLGAPEAFLKAAELEAGYVADDISENLYAYAQACAVRRLEEVEATLQMYNIDYSRRIFPSKPAAVNEVANELISVSGSISSCTERP